MEQNNSSNLSFNYNVDINSNSTENELFDKLHDFSCSHIFWRNFLTDLCRVILYPLYRTCWSVYTPAGLWYFASHVTSRDTITQTFPGSNFLRAIPGKLVLEILKIFWLHGSKSMVWFSSMMSSLMRVWWLMINGIDSTRKPSAR